MPTVSCLSASTTWTQQPAVFVRINQYTEHLWKIKSCKKGGKWQVGKKIGRQLQGDYAPQWLRQNENSQSWCQTLSNFCRLKSSLHPKGEGKGDIFCGIRSSLCHRDPMGPPLLQTNWSVLCQLQLSAEKKKETTAVSFAYGLCLWAAPHANLTLKYHTAENTCLLCGRTSQVPITSGTSALFWSSPHFDTSHS